MKTSVACRVLEAIVGNEVERFREILDFSSLEKADKTRLRNVVFNKQKFTRLGEAYDGNLHHALLGVLVMPSRLTSPAVHPDLWVDDFYLEEGGLNLGAGDPDLEAGGGPMTPLEMTGDEMLDACLQNYKGGLLHIAAALDRASIVDTLLRQVGSMGWMSPNNSPALKHVLRAWDSEGHTALEVAIQGNSYATVEVLMDCLLDGDRIDQETALPIVRFTVKFYTFMHCRRPVKKAVRVLMSMAEEYVTDWRCPLHALIQSCSLKPLQTFLRKLNTCAMEGASYLLHAAVWLYSPNALTDVQRRVLKYLMNCPDVPEPSRKEVVNDLCLFNALWYGSAVHFAILRLTECPVKYETTDPVNSVDKTNPDNTDGAEKEPENIEHHESNPLEGDWKQSRDKAKRASAKIGETTLVEGQFVHLVEDGLVESTLDFLDIFHQHGADFARVNYKGKTALDLLYHDADPRIIDKLLHVMRHPHQA
ncbi:hypothetical protein ACOMHN_062369 [Nucella lapillus]